MTTLEPPRPAAAADLRAVTRTLALPADPRIAEALGLHHRLETALADLIDNSIDAGASRVWIRFVTSNAWVKEIVVADDGRGMRHDEMAAALTLGGQQQYDDNRLGHFGVGLKASAFSQAERLVVVSRSADSTAVAMSVARRDEMLRAQVHDFRQATRALESPDLPEHIATGTVLRLMGVRSAPTSPDRSQRAAWLHHRIQRLREHLGLTFHRFLDSGHLAIVIDEWDIALQESSVPFRPQPIDPFGVPTASNRYPRALQAALPDGSTLNIQCTIIGPRVKGPTVKIFGKDRSDWQGLYVYRNGRILKSGGWDDVIVSPDRSALQLARVDLSVPSDAVKWFTMNPEKDGVFLLPDLVHAIQTASDDSGTTFADFLREAKEALRESNRREITARPIARMGVGFPEPVLDATQALFRLREHDPAVSIRWQNLRPGRLFLFDHERKCIWLNEHHRMLLTGSGQLGAEGLIPTFVFLLLESYFKGGFLQRSTLDQIEAMHTLLAVAAGVGGVTSNDDASSEDVARLDQLPLAPEAAPGAAGRRATDGDRSAREGYVIGRIADLDTEAPTVDSFKAYLNEIGRARLMSAEEEVTLARQIEAGVLADEQLSKMTDQERRSAAGRELAWVSQTGTRAFERFVRANLRLVISIAKRTRRDLLDLPDRVQEGNAGLIQAVKMFDYTLGYKFSTYASHWIRQAIERASSDTGRLIRIPVHMDDLGRQIEAKQRELVARSLEDPTPEEIAHATGIEVAKVKLYLSANEAVESLDEWIDTLRPEAIDDDFDFGVAHCESRFQRRSEFVWSEEEDFHNVLEAEALNA